jgi:hypothetical protein
MPAMSAAMTLPLPVVFIISPVDWCLPLLPIEDATVKIGSQVVLNSYQKRQTSLAGEI